MPRARKGGGTLLAKAKIVPGHWSTGRTTDVGMGIAIAQGMPLVHTTGGMARILHTTRRGV